MSKSAKISLIGLANWNSNLFNEFNWPAAFSPIEDDEDFEPLDKDAFLDELFARTAELELLYPDPDIMERMLASWSKIRVPVWNHMWDTTQYTYNPIENYDRTESGTDTDTNSGTDSYENTLTRSGADTVTDTPDMAHYEAAYDSAASGDNDGLVKSTKDAGENVSETAYDSSDTTEGSTTHGHKIRRDHNLHVHGNIGTVTAQEMIRQEREIAQFNLYELMIQDFKDRFCILVY